MIAPPAQPLKLRKLSSIDDAAVPENQPVDCRGLHAITAAGPPWLSNSKAITLLNDPLEVILAADDSIAVVQARDNLRVVVVGFAMRSFMGE